MGLLSDGLSMLGGFLGKGSENDAKEQLARDQIAAAQAAAAAARFKPVGVTGSPFGTAQYGYDAQGNLTSAGYSPSAFIQNQQGQLQGAAQGMLPQFAGSMAATAPAFDASQRMFNLGGQYLGTSPEAQAAKYMAQQQQLVAPGQQAALDELRARQQATGRTGFAIGGGTEGMMAANPEQSAYWNARLQQEREMASRADIGGQQYAQFGAGLFDTGLGTMDKAYRTQASSAAPWQTAMKGMQYTDELAQQPMQQGMEYGRMIQPGSQAAGQAISQGMLGSAKTMYDVNAYNPWAYALTGAGNALSGMEGDFASMFGMGGGGGMPAGGGTAGGMFGGQNYPQFSAPQSPSFRQNNLSWSNLGGRPL